ncbi:MAG TPA: hypothetical protein VGG29_04020 [Caulobacteraceae bacterium]
MIGALAGVLLASAAAPAVAAPAAAVAAPSVSQDRLAADALAAIQASPSERAAWADAVRTKNAGQINAILMKHGFSAALLKGDVIHFIIDEGGAGAGSAHMPIKVSLTVKFTKPVSISADFGTIAVVNRGSAKR